MTKTKTDLSTEKLKTMNYPSERTIQDIYTYEKQALDLIDKRFENNKDHPNYKKLKALLIDQINDELHDYTNTISNRRAS
jgi:hypothetical protein